MMVFGNYAKYYNLLYRDKDYYAETEYIDRLIKKYVPDAREILDLGCGTGRHDCILAEMGYHVTGVDRSEGMLATAEVQRVSSRYASSLSFQKGDVRTVRLEKGFDVVISLFHVMSYQTTNDDLKSAFMTAAAHMRPGGLFIFDCWYGPAVLTDRPAVRLKRLEDDAIEVSRIAEPVVHPNDNCVTVNYKVFIRDRQTGQVEEIDESHNMRYMFSPEIRLLLDEADMEAVFQYGWMSESAPGFHTWSACFGGRKKR